MKKNNINIAIVVSDFYPELSELLLDDCFNQLIFKKIKKDSISIYKASGVFEIPGVVSQISKQNIDIDAILDRLSKDKKRINSKNNFYLVLLNEQKIARVSIKIKKDK